MRRKIEVDAYLVIAMSIHTGALLDRCKELIVRLTTPDAFEAEVERFRKKAIQHIEDAYIIADGVSEEEIANARIVAYEGIEHDCALWLSEQAAEEQPSIN